MDAYTRKLSRQITLVEKSSNTTLRVTGQFLLFNALLESVSSVCLATQPLNMLLDNALAGQYTLSVETINNAPEELVAILSRHFPANGNIPILTNEYKNCASTYFYIPVQMIPTSAAKSMHTNGILVNRSDGTVYRFEPDSDINQPSRDVVEFDAKTDAGILKALREIGVENPKLYDMNVTCPQTIAKDENCMYWTAFMVREVLTNIQSREPRDVIRDITRTPPNIEEFKAEVQTKLIPEFLEKNGVQWKMEPAKGGVLFPAKYFKGLSTRKASTRRGEFTRRRKMSFKSAKAYVPFKTDKGVKTKKSSYTERFHRKYPGATSLPDIAKATGIPKSILDKVHDRGMAAWRTGHRPGASQNAWAMARVYSFALKGKTYTTADADLARKV